jgi:hypothetical protein
MTQELDVTEENEITVEEAKQAAAIPPEKIPGAEDLPEEVRDGTVDDDNEDEEE